MSKIDRVAVVVPVHDEAAVVGDVVRGLRRRFATVVCVDDGSTDRSAEAARAAGADVVRHPVNLGQGAALVTGIRRALRDDAVTHVVTFDADGQHDPADAAALVAAARELDVQVVLGSRFLDGAAGVPARRRVLLRAATRLTRLTTGLRLTDTHNGLRVLRRDAAEGLALRLHGMAHASEILARVAAERWTYVERPVTVTYSAYARGKGQPGYNALNIAFEVAVGRLRHAA